MSGSALMTVDWATRVDEWTGHLQQSGWPLGMDDELRLHVLAEALRSRGVAVNDVPTAIRWFGPLLARSPTEQQQLRQVLSDLYGVASADRSHDPDGVPPTDETAWSRGIVSVVVVLAVLIAGYLLYLGVSAERLPSLAKLAAVVSGGGVSIDTRWLWGVGSLIVIGVAGALAWRSRRRIHSALLWRGRAPRAALRSALTLELGGTHLYDQGRMRVALAGLGSFRRVDSAGVDGSASAAATLRNGGCITLVRRARRVQPDYLLLVDRKAGDDLLVVLGDMLAGLLVRGNVQVDRYDFLADPRKLRRVEVAKTRRGESDDSVELQTLRSTCSDHRVLILSDAMGFCDDRGENLRGWMADLRQWSDVSLLTPLPPAQWGPRERTLSRLGILIVQATSSGLGELADVLRTDRRPAESAFRDPASAAVHGAGSRSTAFDRMFNGDPFQWLGDTPPHADQQIRLVVELRRVLGPIALLYLQALAVFPLVHPRLTLAVGGALNARGSVVLDEDTLALLCRVPWMRWGRLPDWLRVALLRELSSRGADEGRVRDTWDALLAPPEKPKRLGARDFSIQVVRPSLNMLEGRLRRLLGRSPDPLDSEALLIAFMSGRALPELSVRVPVWPADEDLTPSTSRDFQGRWRRTRKADRTLLRESPAARAAAADKLPQASAGFRHW